MDEAIYDGLLEVIGWYNQSDQIDPRLFEDKLTEYGFMIVPIEDPTNLRFGVDE